MRETQKCIAIPLCLFEFYEFSLKYELTHPKKLSRNRENRELSKSFLFSSCET